MKILKLQGKVEILSGLHIGGGDDTMKIGGVDRSVIKASNRNSKGVFEPYIPGSSLKGKMRSLLEWDIGVVHLERGDKEKGNPLCSSFIWDKDGKFKDVAFNDSSLLSKSETLLKLFGDKDGKFGITRINVGDSSLASECLEAELILFESKMENTIDRQTGTAKHGVGARQTERVPAGVKFDYDIKIKILENDNETDFKAMVARGLELIENDYLGGSGSRGYGRVRFSNKTDWIE